MLFFRKKWKLHLYLNGIYVGKKLIDENDNPGENSYIVHFWFKKQIFKSNHVKSIIHPTTLIKNEENKKTTHWNFEYEEGVEL